MNDEHMRDIRSEIAAELRQVADDLENEDISLTESPSITYRGFDESFAIDVELCYLDTQKGERLIEVTTY